jgi:hypothetical protein
MYQPLVPCPRCERHVRTDESACPFCSAALPSNLAARAIPGATQRLSRAAAFLFGASLTVAGCGSEISTGAGSGGGSDPTGSSSDSSAASGGMTDAGPDDDGGNVPLYGDPTPIDGGPDDDGGGMAEYGTPPPVDAGKDDGGAQPLYGAPPMP